MRCLYCGKGLALLKRLRGGGEFCSEAHRLKYQEEYNQLALSRLLQAQPPEEPPASNGAGANGAGPNGAGPNGQDRNGASANGQNGLAAHAEESELVAAPAASPASHAKPEPSKPEAARPAPAGSSAILDRLAEAAVAPAPAANIPPAEAAAVAEEPEPEAQAPAPMAGFIGEIMLPQPAETPALVVPGLYFSVVVRPEQPHHEPAVASRGSESSLAPEHEEHGAGADMEGAPARVGAVALAISVRSAEPGSSIRVTGLELRESGRMTPVTAPVGVLELHTCGPGDGEGAEGDPEAWWARREQPLVFAIPPVAPENAAGPWVGLAEEFSPLPIELGDLGRLAFSTEGFTELPGSGGATPSAAPAEPARGSETEPQRAPSAPMSIDAQRQEASPPASAGVEPVAAEGVQIDPAFLQSLARLELSPMPPPSALPASGAAGRAVPDRATRPLPLTLHGFPPGRGKAAQIYTAPLRAVPEIQIPSTGVLPLRPTMVLGPAPAAAAPARTAPTGPGTASAPASDEKNKAARPSPAPVAEPAKLRSDSRPTLRKPQRPGERAVETVKPETGRPELAKPEPAKAELVKPELGKPEFAKAETPKSEPAKAEAAKPETKSEPGKPETSKSEVSRPDPAKLRRIEPSAAADASGKQAAAAKSVKAETKTERASEVKGDAKTESKPESRVESKPEAKPEPGPEPGPEAKPAQTAPAADTVDLGLPSLQMDGRGKSRMPAPAVLVAVLAVVGAIGAGVYLLGGKSTKPAGPPVAAVSDVVETGTPLSVAEGGWIDDWAPQPPNPKVLRVLSILRGSLPLSDYRMEFEAQIESKALGWVFRALNPKNYYVTKLEIVKPGIEPTVEVVHFAMIDGDEQQRVRTPLSVKVRVDTSYQVRFEALGDRFTTYVQGQKVDEWTDNRVGRGGAGLYRERGESALLKGTVRMTLIAKKK